MGGAVERRVGHASELPFIRGCRQLALGENPHGDMRGSDERADDSSEAHQRMLPATRVILDMWYERRARVEARRGSDVLMILMTTPKPTEAIRANS